MAKNDSNKAEKQHDLMRKTRSILRKRKTIQRSGTLRDGGRRAKINRSRKSFDNVIKIPKVSEISTIEFQSGDANLPFKPPEENPPVKDSLKKEKDATNTNNQHPPDGGWGWVVTLSSFFINTFIIGMHNSFAVLYLDLRDEFQQSFATTAWVGSIAFGSILLFAPLSGFLANIYGCRNVALLGVIIASSGLLASSYATSLSMLFFTYGFMYGFGTSLCYMQGTVMVARYFTTKRALASGVALSGSTLGALVMAPFYEKLQQCLKWRKSLRVISGCTFLMVLCASSYRPLQKPGTATTAERIKRSPARKFVRDYSLWKNKAFLVWAVAVGLSKLGYLVPWVHMVNISQDAGFSRQYGSKLIQYMGVAATISRLFIGKIVDLPQVNRQYVSQISSFFMGVVHIIQAYTSHTEAGLIAYSIMLGILDGGIEILLPLMTLDLVGAENLSIAWGCILAVISLSSLGPPVAGKIRDKNDTYFWAFYFTGVPMIMAALVLFLIPWARRQPQPPATSILSINPSHLEIMEPISVGSQQLTADLNSGIQRCRARMDSIFKTKKEKNYVEGQLIKKNQNTLHVYAPYNKPIPLPGT